MFPAHDYKGDTVSTIGEERRHNPRLQVRNADEYAALMAGLNLPNPKMMDVAVPANLRQGFAQDEVARLGWALTADEAIGLCADGHDGEVVLVDLREGCERAKHGALLGALSAPYGDLRAQLAPGGMLHALARRASDRRLVFYCAHGERSAMAVRAAQDSGLSRACHIQGGLAAWTAAGGPVSR